MPEILVTGGAGYIGSHTAAALAAAGYSPVVIDNLSNSRESVIARLEKLTGKKIPFYNADVRDGAALDAVFAKHSFSAAIHFAGLKAVGESVQQPLRYYEHNLTATMSLLAAMQKHGVKSLIFSSSATVYREDDEVPYIESGELGCSNPYGWTKLFSEQIIRDVCAANPGFSAVLLRYFNPIGADKSGLIGEEPQGVPNNLLPYVSQVAAGIRPRLSVFGNDYPTPDGTCIRDYIHVSDLARAHALALDFAANNAGAKAINIGTGRGYSVLEVVAAFEKASGVKIPFEITGRRAGDIPEYFANPALAREKLGFTAELGIEEMCRDAWRFEQNRKLFPEEK
ncbi:MAG: UDP-glucose 4-epimerase GalE [Oscillospiraceae bacterium]|jgi:UDP-glucose 4-epimerase|nr:UDP-glucose 4-epimerase GalE [Oscillospiraceae bacterium]